MIIWFWKRVSSQGNGEIVWTQTVYCISHLPCCYDKIPDHSNSRKGAFPLAHGWLARTAVESWWLKYEAVSYLHPLRKQGQRDAQPQPAFSFGFSLGPSYRGHLEWVIPGQLTWSRKISHQHPLEPRVRCDCNSIELTRWTITHAVLSLHTVV